MNPELTPSHHRLQLHRSLNLGSWYRLFRRVLPNDFENAQGRAIKFDDLVHYVYRISILDQGFSRACRSLTRVEK
jgi:hypothetical protein